MQDGITAVMAIQPADEHYHMCTLHGTVNACSDVNCVHGSDVNLRCATCDSDKNQVVNSLVRHPLDLARLYFAREVKC